MIQTRTVAPADYPVTLADIKADLRIQHDAEDDLIHSLIAAATDYMDLPNGVIGKALMEQTWTVSVHRPHCDRIEIPVTPVKSIESITYYDADDVEQTLDVADYRLYKTEDWAYIVPKVSGDWPTTYDRRDGITITIIAGYDAVPETVKQAIRLLVAHWYEHRMAVTDKPLSEMPLAVQSLVNMNRKGWVA